MTESETTPTAWLGWSPGFIGAAWLTGELTTAELDSRCQEPEVMRSLRDQYVEELIERYHHERE